MDKKQLIGIIFFLISVILIYNLAGGKTTAKFLYLIIFGILVVNVDKIPKLN